MSKDNKEMKLRVQKGRDAHAAIPDKGQHVAKPTHSKYGTMRSQSDPIEPWAKTTERATQARRNKIVKVTLPKMPWDEEK
jgi:hypothetical protein